MSGYIVFFVKDNFYFKTLNEAVNLCYFNEYWREFKFEIRSCGVGEVVQPPQISIAKDQVSEVRLSKVRESSERELKVKKESLAKLWKEVEELEGKLGVGEY